MFAELAERLLDRGWSAVMPLVGKRPVMRGWDRWCEQPLDPIELKQMLRCAPMANIGLPVPTSVVVIDVDVLDEAQAATLTELLFAIAGPTDLIRIGRPPKAQYFYRPVEIGTIRSRKLHPIEVFCGSGQVALFGRHPDTGQPYHWPQRSPIDIGPADLPPISSAALEMFLHHAVEIIGRTAIPRASPGGSVGFLNANGTDHFQRLREERANAAVIGVTMQEIVAVQLRRCAETGAFVHCTVLASAAAWRNASLPATCFEQLVYDTFKPGMAGWRDYLQADLKRSLRDAQRQQDQQYQTINRLSGLFPGAGIVTE
jgi:hypothetical protein